jgi:myo-inositol-1(or 4)-monophosphatase
MKKYLEFAKTLALDSGEIMLNYFHQLDKLIETKTDQTLVTIADKKINELVIKRVKEQFPKHGVLGEESSYEPNRDLLWVVDPLDGTGNFAAGIPLFVFSIALVDYGSPIVAVIYDPFTQRLYWASVAEGSFMNGKRLDITKTSNKNRLTISSWVAGGRPGVFLKDKDAVIKMSEAYIKKGGIIEHDVPVADALAMLAGGFFDATLTSCENPWDLAAGGLIAEEAGAKVTDLFGKRILWWHSPIRGVLAAPPDIHKAMLNIVHATLREEDENNRH